MHRRRCVRWKYRDTWKSFVFNTFCRTNMSRPTQVPQVKEITLSRFFLNEVQILYSNYWNYTNHTYDYGGLVPTYAYTGGEEKKKILGVRNRNLISDNARILWYFIKLNSIQNPLNSQWQLGRLGRPKWYYLSLNLFFILVTFTYDHRAPMSVTKRYILFKDQSGYRCWRANCIEECLRVGGSKSF